MSQFRFSQCNISNCTERQTLWHRQIRKSISISGSDEQKCWSPGFSPKLTHLSRWLSSAPMVAVIIVLSRSRLMGVGTNSSLIASTKLITGQQWTKNQRKYTAGTIIGEPSWKKTKNTNSTISRLPLILLWQWLWTFKGAVSHATSWLCYQNRISCGKLKQFSILAKLLQV